MKFMTGYDIIAVANRQYKSRLQVCEPRFHSAELTNPGSLSRGTMYSLSRFSGSNVRPA
jgi:hypothetical protein